MRKKIQYFAVFAFVVLAGIFLHPQASFAAEWCALEETGTCVKGGGGPCPTGTTYKTETECKKNILKWCYLTESKTCVKGGGGPCPSGKTYNTQNLCNKANAPAAATPASSTSGETDSGSSFIPKKPPGYQGPLPDCAFDGSCRNVNDVLELMVNWGQRIFGMIGSFALVMFVYGGFVMIFSAGNSEKVKQGRDILTAAVIGLVIAFSAYLLIDFILDALNVSEEFRGVNQ